MVATGPRAPATFPGGDAKKPVNLNLGGGPGQSRLRAVYVQYQNVVSLGHA